jgi:hypothetical protein
MSRNSSASTKHAAFGNLTQGCYALVPNPSIERTCSSGLRPLPHAAHVKR